MRSMEQKSFAATTSAPGNTRTIAHMTWASWSRVVLTEQWETSAETTRTTCDRHRQMYSRAMLACNASLDRTLRCSCFAFWRVAVQYRKDVQRARRQESLHKSSVAINASLLRVCWVTWQWACRESADQRCMQLQGRMQCSEVASCVLTLREKSSSCCLQKNFFRLWQQCVDVQRACREQTIQRCTVASATLRRLCAASSGTLLHRTWTSGS